MTDLIKPMLAKPAHKVKGFTPFGWFASGKIDGFRATVQINQETGNPMVYTRSLKPHPNDHVQTLFARDELVGFDGELVVDGNFNEVSSALRRKRGCPKVKFYVFDLIHPGPFIHRREDLRRRFTRVDQPEVMLLPQFKVIKHMTVDELDAHFTRQGFEGVCFRHPDGHYKQGPNRSKDLVKVKTFQLDTATVVGWEPVRRNNNEPFTDKLGRQKRSSHASGKEVDNTMVGALVCKSEKFSETFNVGSGFDHATARKWVSNLPTIIQYKYQPHGSTNERPRIPIFVSCKEK